MAEELLTVLEFAQRYRVEAATVRYWIREKMIPYTLVGSRKMICRSHVLKPVIPEEICPVTVKLAELKAYEEEYDDPIVR